ncbi:MAG: bifunctional hydroxymethylpyrimidine kinase/phosphomethylpyrimidine kinase [Succinivibrio sp.]|jgi:pyridoxine kinase|nr:bifunctional hydroxymethylpyrimidine kinase/phosphomethylpyrimidine kinase [Succinivibrio sp.]
MKKRLLLIGDLPCYGRIAVNAMLPILTHTGFDVSVLPTALVSNNFAYGKFDVLDTTEFMRKTLGYWKELGFSFDAVYTGYLSSRAQTDLVASCLSEFRARGIPVFTDPIMGDHGSLYNGVTEENVQNMRRIVSLADFIVPNLTEACYLSKFRCRAEGFSKEETDALVNALRALTPGTVIITSAVCEGRRCVCGYDAQNHGNFSLPYTEIDREFHGTGDVFAALFISLMLKSGDAVSATQGAMDGVSAMIRRNRGNTDVFDGLNIESCLDLI